MSTNNRSLGIIIPVFNEKDVLPHLFQRLSRLQDELPALREVIFVDDGSVDGSFALLLDAAKRHTGWRVLRFSRNFGQQSAMLAGLRSSTTDGVVLMDADLQDPPEVIPQMVELWDQGWDVVYGVRRKRHGERWIKRTTARLFYRLLARLSDVAMPLDAGDFRLMDRKVVEVLNQLGEQRPYVRGLVAWAGFRQTSLHFDRQSRVEGRTSYNLRRMLALSLDAIIGFSSAPLRVVTQLGVLTVVVSLIYSLVVLGLWLADINVPGWTSMMLIILFLGSVQLISLGIIGEYLANLLMEVKGRPRYIVAFDSNGVGDRPGSFGAGALKVEGGADG